MRSICHRPLTLQKFSTLRDTPFEIEENCSRQLTRLFYYRFCKCILMFFGFAQNPFPLKVNCDDPSCLVNSCLTCVALFRSSFPNAVPPMLRFFSLITPRTCPQDRDELVQKYLTALFLLFGLIDWLLIVLGLRKYGNSFIVDMYSGEAGSIIRDKLNCNA